MGDAFVGGMVAEWLVLQPHSKNALGLIPRTNVGPFSVEWHVLPMFV